MEDQNTARWPFRVLAVVVALLAPFAAVILARDLIMAGRFEGLPIIATALFFCWRYFWIGATGKDNRIKPQPPENNSPSAH